MTSLNELIQPKRENISSIVGKVKEDIYFVDQSFQRKLIWTQSQKIKLIETILMGYPMPEVYLWAQKSDPNSGVQKFSIVDGQQRLTTINQFISGEWSLNKLALHNDNVSSEYANEDWSSLPNELKQKIWEYNIDVREIPSSVDKPTINKIFTRLNQTDKSLNPQELRNAEFHGEFINASVDIADKLNGYGWKIFSDHAIRRMKDVDFCSQILTYLIRGIVSTPPKTLNELYDRYNDEYADRRKHLKQTIKIFEQISSLFEQKSVLDLFRKPVHFYSIFAVVDLANQDSLQINVKDLKNFVEEYSNADFKNTGVNPLLLSYYRGSSNATSSKSGREKRVFSLLDYLKGKA